MARERRNRGWRHLVHGAAVLALCVSTVAPAAVVNFSGQGQVAPMEPGFDPAELPWKLVATDIGGYNFGGRSLGFSSSFVVQFAFDPDSGAPFPVGGAGDFILYEAGGPDRLQGTVVTTAIPGGFLIDYTITDAGGLYADVTGTGQSTVTFIQDPSDPRTLPRYLEAGVFNLAFPDTSVPEPAVPALLLAAALAAAGSRRALRAAGQVPRAHAPAGPGRPRPA